MGRPDIKLVRNLSGEGFFRPEGAQTFTSLGHIEKISTTASVTEEDIYSSISGSRTLEDSEVSEANVAGTAVLRQTGAKELAMALLAKDGSLTQSAETGILRTGAAKAGDVVDFGRLDITITAHGDLIEGEDFEVDAEAGIVTFLVATPYDLAASCAAIVAADNRAMIEALSARDGIRGDLMVVQRQTRGGTRFKYNAKVAMFPDGELALHDDSGAKTTVQMRFKVVADTTKPASRRYGYLQEIK